LPAWIETTVAIRIRNIVEEPGLIQLYRPSVLVGVDSIESGRPVALIAFGALVVGILVALAAQFALDSLADRGDFFHQLQHGMLFGGGVAVGAACLALYRHGQRVA